MSGRLYVSLSSASLFFRPGFPVSLRAYSHILFKFIRKIFIALKPAFTGYGIDPGIRLQKLLCLFDTHPVELGVKGLPGLLLEQLSQITAIVAEHFRQILNL